MYHSGSDWSGNHNAENYTDQWSRHHLRFQTGGKQNWYHTLPTADTVEKLETDAGKVERRYTHRLSFTLVKLKAKLEFVIYSYGKTPIYCI